MRFNFGRVLVLALNMPPALSSQSDSPVSLPLKSGASAAAASPA
jgi:hypothetical protein